MKLVIVESPTKAKTISKFLSKDYQIRASMGHVMDLPKSKLGVDVQHDFLPDYQLSLEKKKTVAELKKLAKEADEVILATDPDREGEAISAHIKELLSHEKRKQGKFSRIVFHEITREAIEEALKHPGQVNVQLVDAQTARRVLDRLVGYKISPVLWQKVRRGLSAGRVQSVALRLIVEREREIGKFAKENYWTVSVLLESGTEVPNNVIARSETTKQSKDELAAGQSIDPRNDVVSFDLIEINGEKIEKQESSTLYDGKYTVTKTTIATEERAHAIAKELQAMDFVVREVLQKQTKRSPVAPFTTSTLQQEAARRLGYSGKRTMSLAQKLYEEGFITYHRTDSVNLAASAVTAVRAFIAKSYGERYVPEKPRFFATKQKLAQEAHEAIRPTQVATSLEKIQAELGKDYAKLYDLIWRRFVACQMSEALIESTTVLVDALPYTFKTTGSVLVFDGFLKVTPYSLQDKNLPKFTALEHLNLQDVHTEKHETPPPPRYNDASLIGALEEEGIGRPSTYASIISTIIDRQYVEKQQGKFFPTSVGMAVTDFLVQNFPNIDDIPFTAQMENELDEIANNGKPWVPVMKDFYGTFERQLAQVGGAQRVEIPTEETGEMCPKDGAPLVVRVGKFGKFISCKNFPTCDFKKPYVETTAYLCPKDGGQVIVKKTKKGRTFYGCSNYPKCDFAVWKLEDIKKDTQAKETANTSAA